MIVTYMALLFAIIGLVIYAKAVIEDLQKENLRLTSKIGIKDKEIKSLEESVKFGLSMRAAWTAKLAKMRPMEALSELQNEAERNERLQSDGS